RRIREGTATPTPDRRGSHPGTGAASAFLAPGLLGGMLDGAAVLLGAVAHAGVGLVGHDDLVHQRFVEVAAEDLVGSSNGGRGLTLIVQELEFHGSCPFLGVALTAGRTTTSASLWPGTGPFAGGSPRSASARTLSRFWTVRVTQPR